MHYSEGERGYLQLLQYILTGGDERQDRTGVGTFSLFGPQLTFDLSTTFPLLQSKKINYRAVIIELLWFLSGETNIQYLTQNKVHIWDEWADENGDLGPVYGKQWRSWLGANGQTTDQIAEVIQGLKVNPHSRRHIVSAWNVGDLDKMALPPCHLLFQFYIDSDNALSCHMYQRSADLFLGVPFNIASYSLLTCMIAKVCQLKRGSLTISFGDVHIYKNHQDQVLTQLRRPVPLTPGPTLDLPGTISNIFGFTPSDIQINNYSPLPAIAAPIAV